MVDNNQTIIKSSQALKKKKSLKFFEKTFRVQFHFIQLRNVETILFAVHLQFNDYREEEMNNKILQNTSKSFNKNGNKNEHTNC